MPERAMPGIDWPAVGLGTVAAAVIALALLVGSGVAHADIGPIAEIVGVVAGGYVAGLRARIAGAAHGALVAAALIVVLGLGVLPQPGVAGNVVADTALTVLSDLVVLAAGTGGGWLATRGASLAR
ncbi:MAG: hypothetical protein ABR525_06945 [Candidatus Limnocylindria bacterium]